MRLPMLPQRLRLNWSIYGNPVISVTYINSAKPDHALARGNMFESLLGDMSSSANTTGKNEALTRTATGEG